MILRMAALAATIAFTAVAGPLVTVNLFGTAENSSGAIMAVGSLDPHWTLVSSADPNLAGPDLYVTKQNSAWYHTPRWISPQTDSTVFNVLGGQYHYQTSFDMTGLDTSTFFADINYASDNEVLDILINGTSLGYGLNNPSISFTDLQQMSIDGSVTPLNPGLNTLTYIVRNRGVGGIDSNPTSSGFWLDVTADARVADVPEPAAWMLSLAGLVGLAARRRWR